MNVAFIPVRGGSKSIPLKNIKPLAGKPLVYWVTRAACQCRFIDKVYIATDSDAIKKAIQDFLPESNDFEKVEVIGRSPETAADTASTESAMLEFAAAYSFKNIVLIQATSPLLTQEDLNGGFALYDVPDTDSVASCVRQKHFIWNLDHGGYGFSINYNLFNRPRRQEFDGYLVENGAFYITSRERLLSSRNRISGRIRMYEMPEESFYEIDEEADWIIIENLLRKRLCGNNVSD